MTVKRILVFLLVLLVTEQVVLATNVGIFYSPTSEKYYGSSTYKTIIDGLIEALEFGKINYDIINSLDGYIPENIKVLIDPSNAALTDSEVSVVENFILNGGKLLAAYESSLRFPDGKLRMNYAYGDFLSIKFKSWGSGKYYFLQPTDDGEKVFNVSNIINLPRGFAFLVETTENSTPLALWVKEDKTIVDEKFPSAAVLTQFGIFFGENIYLHTSVSDEIKIILVNAVKFLAQMPPAEVDFMEYERKKLSTKIFDFEQAISEQYKAFPERARELEEKVKNFKAKLYADSDINSIKELKKELDLLQIGLLKKYSIQTRGIWLDNQSIKKTGSPERLRETIRKLHSIGFNMIIPEVIYKGKTMASKLSYFPQDDDFQRWSEDPLQVIVDEAKKLNMEVHAWCWVFAASSGGEENYFIKNFPDWIEKDKYGNIFTKNGTAWFSHSNPQTREYLIDGILEIAKKYEIDGINLDYIRYDGDEMGYDEHAVKGFMEETGIDPYKIEKYSKDQVIWHMWREEKINSFVEELYKRAKALDDRLLISADVYPSLSGARNEKKQNWEAWVRNKYIDALIPMNYKGSIEDLKIVLEMQTKFKNMVCLYSGLQMINLKSTEDLIEQIKTSINYLSSGIVLFSLSYLDRYDEDYIRNIFGVEAICAHSEINSLVKAFERKLHEDLALCQDLGLSESEVNIVLEKWEKIEFGNDVGNIFSQLSEFFYYISDNIKNPKAALILSDEISWMMDILRPKVYKAMPVEKFVPEKPVDMIVVDNIKPLPKVIVPFGHAKVDGIFDEWKDIDELSRFFVYDTGEIFQPYTSVKVMYDDANLYVQFLCEEPYMNDVKKVSGPRDTRTYLGDSVEVFILKNERDREYYHFVIGIDGTIYDEKGLDSKWNGDIEAITTLSDNLWCAEIRINLRTIGLEPVKGGILKANFTRNRWRAGKPQYSCWSVTYGSYHTIERFGTLIFGE
ncbi:family 10 glycosylhydrolase [Pseudothermotoga sp.]|jgi:uncharacterized lipoprotein YddW (UPF0748 family)|uniref:family 10 glycosylhydrolase n=1 Tax=Pseudothermotoga sp. TaxID=2033661 RepID=UPI000E912A1D|nr:family 10 glycosylhydrolase [Pseudothermotoga sp.]HBJ80445.1 hypothetical protein [Pseudothermotoga sp.]